MRYGLLGWVLGLAGGFLVAWCIASLAPGKGDVPLASPDVESERGPTGSAHRGTGRAASAGEPGSAVEEPPAPLPGPVEELGLSPEEREWLGKALERERRRRLESAIREVDDGLAVLRRVFQAGADPLPLIRDFDAFRSHALSDRGTIWEAKEGSAKTPRSDGRPRWQKWPVPPTSMMNGDSGNLPRSSPEELTIRLGPGSYSPLRIPEQIRFLTVVGAGMDATEVGGATIQGARVNLTLRDLTLSDEVRLDDTCVSFERVRMTGVVSVLDNGFLACDGCEFPGESSRNGRAYSLRLGGRVLAVYRRCRFSSMDRVIRLVNYRIAKGTCIRFEDCDFVHAALIRPRIPNESFDFPLQLEVVDCRFSWDEEHLREDVQGERIGLVLATLMRGNRFLFESGIFMPSGISSFLQALSAQEPGPVLGVELAGAPRPDGTVPIAVMRAREPHALSPGTYRTLGETTHFSWKPGAAPERLAGEKKAALFPASRPFSFDGPMPVVLSVRDLLAKLDLPRDRELQSFWLTTERTAAGTGLVYEIEFVDRSRPLRIDAVTGEAK